LEGLVNLTPSSPADNPFEEEVSGEEKKVKDEAKSNRKVFYYSRFQEQMSNVFSFQIADLEITTRSLLAINSSLEATKHRQAKEIRDLRRKLRESRLILPPKTFRTLTENSDDDDDESSSEDEDEDNVEAELDSTNTNPSKQRDPVMQSFKRINLLISELISAGQNALDSKPQDFVGPPGSLMSPSLSATTVSGGSGIVKVLSQAEVDEYHKVDDDESVKDYMNAIRVPIPEGDDEDLEDNSQSGSDGGRSLQRRDSEMEVERMLATIKIGEAKHLFDGRPGPGTSIPPSIYVSNSS
jgi:hypothetical protein